MDDNHRPNDYIEGEFEVVEEREASSKQPNNNGGNFFESKKPITTYAILALNILAFIVMSIAGLIFDWDLNTQLYIFGSKVNYLIVQGQYWRLLTAMFLHVGIIHLFFNSYALYIYGPIVEKLFGRIKFLTIYILSGLAGSLLSYILSPNPAAGASGAIFGLMGALLYFRQKERYLFKRIFGPQLMIIIAINLVYGFVQPGIDNFGHLGGLAGGFLVASGLGLFNRKTNAIKSLFIFIIIGLLFVTGIYSGRRKYAADLYISQAVEEYNKGNILQAEELTIKAAENGSDNEILKALTDELLVSKIEKYTSNGDLSKALEYANMIVEYYPNEINYLYIRAQLYEILENYKDALNDYLVITVEQKDYPEGWYKSGLMEYKLGNLNKAEEYLNKALELNPNHTKAQSLLNKIEGTV